MCKIICKSENVVGKDLIFGSDIINFAIKDKQLNVSRL